MGWACLALVVALPVTLVVYWATAEAPELAMQGNLPATALQAPLQTWQRWSCAAVTAVPLGMMLMGLWQARRCFVQFADGQVFTAQATAHLRRFASWVAAAALGAIVSGAITSVLLTLHNPPGMRHLSIGVGSSQVLTLFFAAVVWLMADIIGQGQRLAEENDAFV
jgi:hypothetical protein